MKPVAMKPVSKSSSPTIRDVARAAGVSPGTVSRVLNNSPLVTEATRKRVLRVVEELDYRPNLIAQRLSLGKTLRIGVIVPFFTRPAEIERLKGVVSSLSKSHYDLVIHNVETPEQRNNYFRLIPHREQVDGVIMISIPPREEDIPVLENSNVPIVFVDVHHPGITTFDRVIGDDVQGGYLATQHLIQQGHRKIGFIGDLPDNPFEFTSSQDRDEGYRQALADAGLGFDPDCYALDEHGQYTAHLLSKQMLCSSCCPTAIFAASDTQAIGVLAAARSIQRTVPEQLSVIGFDDIEVAEYLGLTTIHQQLFESGQIGVELLLDRIMNPDKPVVTYQVQNELIVRSTTAPPKE
jgi:LacI family transcriptional regulator